MESTYLDKINNNLSQNQKERMQAYQSKFLIHRITFKDIEWNK